MHCAPPPPNLKVAPRSLDKKCFYLRISATFRRGVHLPKQLITLQILCTHRLWFSWLVEQERGSVKFHSGGQIRGIIDHVRNKKGWNLSEGNRMESCGRMKTDYKEDLILYSHMVAIVVCEIFSCQCRRPKETKREKLKRILFRFKGLQLNVWFYPQQHGFHEETKENAITAQRLTTKRLVLSSTARLSRGTQEAIITAQRLTNKCLILSSKHGFHEETKMNTIMTEWLTTKRLISSCFEASERYVWRCL